MKQKTSMFGSAMSSYSKPEQSNGETLESQKKVGRPKGSIKNLRNQALQPSLTMICCRI